MATNLQSSISGTIGKTLNAALLLVCHFGLATILIVGFHFIEVVVKFIGSNGGDLVFGLLPLGYIFQAVDVAMIVLVAATGLLDTYKALR